MQEKTEWFQISFHFIRIVIENDTGKKKILSLILLIRSQYMFLFRRSLRYGLVLGKDKPLESKFINAIQIWLDMNFLH